MLLCNCSAVGRRSFSKKNKEFKREIQLPNLLP